MVRVIATDFRKMISSYHVYLCMMGLGLMYFVMYLGSLNSNTYMFGIVASYENVAEGTEIMLLAFLLSIVGGSFLYCEEEKHGYLKFVIQRIGVKRFTAGKLFTSLIGGFGIVMAGNIIYLVGIIVHRWIVFGTVSFEGEDMAYMFWEWMFSALRCGVLSEIGFLVSTYVANYYIAMTTPLLMYYAILSLETWIPVFFPMIPSKFFFTDVYLAGYIKGNDSIEFVFALFYTACISLIMYSMVKKRIERRMEHA